MINSKTARSDILKEVYDLISNNITGVKVTVAFVEDETKFPQVVINTPILPREKETYERYNRSGEVDIDIYTTSIKSLNNISDEVEDIIFTNKETLSFQRPEIGTSTTAQISLSQKQIHTLTIPLSFTYRSE